MNPDANSPAEPSVASVHPAPARSALSAGLLDSTPNKQPACQVRRRWGDGKFGRYFSAGLTGARKRARGVLAVWGWAGFAGWCGLLAHFATRPGCAVDEKTFGFLMQHWDKAAHGAYFAAGGFLLASALEFTFRWKNAAVFALAFPALLLAGFLDEWVQMSVPMRQGGDPVDFSADAIGAFAGILLAIWIYDTLRKASGRPR